MPNLEQYQADLRAIAAAIQVIDHVPTINIEDDTLAPVNSIDDIEYQQVVFKYKSRSEPAVRGISIKIIKGKTTAFIGESGSGKSAIVKLLSRLYDPTEGKVLVNGHGLRTIICDSTDGVLATLVKNHDCSTSRSKQSSKW